MKYETFHVEINSHWRVQLNHEGDGLLLAVDRGIPCENHTQVISVHATNTPSEEAVRRVIERERDRLNNRITAFVDFVRAHDDWAFKELIGVQFKHHLLSTIARWAEVEQHKIWEAERAKKTD